MKNEVKYSVSDIDQPHGAEKSRMNLSEYTIDELMKEINQRAIYQKSLTWTCVICDKEYIVGTIHWCGGHPGNISGKK